MLDIALGQASDPGKVRAENEDAMGCFLPTSREELNSHGCLFAVADGVGGMECGEIASSTAIATLLEEFALAPVDSLLTRTMPRILQAANVAVYNRSQEEPYAHKRMATTIVACALRYDHAVISHVGDSRCYLVRDGKIRLLTEDHTWVNEQRRLGLITAEEARESEHRHILTRSLGPELFVSPAKSTLLVRPGDALVLCSDGVHGEIDENVIGEIVSSHRDPQQAADALVRYAVEQDGGDNATAQVIQVRAVSHMVVYRGRRFTQSDASR